MPTEHISAAGQPPLNELGRVAVALPAEATLYGDTHFVAIAWDSASDGTEPQPTILGADRQALPYLPRYRLIDLLCGDRAMRTVDGALRVQHRTVTPEAYLGLWRAALQQPLEPAALAERHGLKILVTLGAALAPVRTSRSTWTSSPFATFAEFEATYGARFTGITMADGQPGFELVLDLREPDAARDAFYAESFVTQRNDAAGHVRMSLAPSGTGPRRQPTGGEQAAFFERSQP